MSPDHRFCIPHPSFARAKAYMQYALHRQEGFVVITGRPGTGKTTLIDDLTHGFSETEFQSARLVSARLEADDLLRMVCFAFEIPAEGADKSELLRRFSTYISRSFKGNRRPLLIVDEAQGLSHGALEELRLLTNQHLNGQPLLQIFLVGQEELRDLLADPLLEQLRQRIVAACHIEPLKPDQVPEYVLHRLRMAGWEGNPRFESALFPLLYRFTQGIPRIINQVCSRLLLHGSLEDKRTLGVKDIELVIEELRSEHLSIVESHAIMDLEAFQNESLETLSQPAKPPVEQGQPIGERLLQVDAPPPVPVEKMVQEVEEILQQQKEMLQQEEESMPEVTQPPLERRVAAVPPPEEPVRTVPELAATPSRRRRDHAPLWGIAATVALGLLLSALALLSAPQHELKRLAPVSTWEMLGVNRARDMVSRWSGGRWPLCEIECVSTEKKPVVAPEAISAPIGHIARVERVAAPALVTREPELPVAPQQEPEQEQLLGQVSVVQPGQPPAPLAAVEVDQAPRQVSVTEPDTPREPASAPASLVKPMLQDRLELVQDAGVELQQARPEVVAQRTGIDASLELQQEPVSGDTAAGHRPQVSVRQVSFGFDSARIEPEYTRLLDQVVSTLKSAVGSSAHIIGYTDNIGDITYNKWLSRRRAEAVAAYITGKGVPQQRLQVEGKGLEPSARDIPPGSSAGRTVKIFLRQGATNLTARLAASDAE